MSVADFIASVTDEIVAHDLSDVTLVGHSMAGLTLPGVAERIPDRLSHLAFVSCAVPPHGTPLTDVLGDLSPAVREVAARIGDDVVDSEGGLHPELFVAMFCNDMDERQTASTLARRVPESFKVLSDPTDLTGLRHPISDVRRFGPRCEHHPRCAKQDDRQPRRRSTSSIWMRGTWR